MGFEDFTVQSISINNINIVTVTVTSWVTEYSVFSKPFFYPPFSSPSHSNSSLFNYEEEEENKLEEKEKEEEEEEGKVAATIYDHFYMSGSPESNSDHHQLL